MAPAVPERWVRALPLLTALAILVVFWRSPSTDQVFYYSSPDSGGRYVLPLATVLAVMLAGFFGGLGALRRQARTPALSTAIQCALLAVLLLAYAVPYLTTNAVRAMQTPYRQVLTFPAQETALLPYLARHHITRVWVSHWIGDVVMYFTDSRILCADAADILWHRTTNRFPAQATIIAASDRPSFIVEGQAGPALLRALNGLGVRYTSARIGDLEVVTPTSRIVRPQEVVAILAQG